MAMENNASQFRFIVGIGASAGGLEALQKLLTALPPNTGFPYIVVQHLSPDYKSLLGAILSKYTTMSVVQAEHGTRIEADTVYIIQPGKNMRIENDTLLLTDQAPKELNLPIDIFFRSLAEEAGSRAIAIILSGTGSDGTNGLKAVKENDGMVMVQDLSTSKFDGMPKSAMRTGLVDAQMSPEEIALELKHISGAAGVVTHEKTDQEIDAALMKKVYLILKKISNVNFTHYKQTTILRRMERRMMLTHKDTLSDYVDYLYEAPDEVLILSKEVLIGVTNFFRDPEFFQLLKEKVVPAILKRSQADKTIRVWSAGCSTGEEAYSIAILFSEVMDEMKMRREIKIFATDLDVDAINTAGKGVYGDNIIDSVSPARLTRYFTRKNNTYTVNRDIRKMIVFSPHNVFQDPPFGRLDLICCRNMLIYFQPVLQNDLFAIFHAVLKDGGFLFLGKSEAIGSYTEAFPVVEAAAKIFTHRKDVKIPGAKKVPFLQTTFLDDVYPSDSEAGYIRQIERDEAECSQEDAIDNAVLEKFMPACVVINEKNELIHTYGPTANYIHLSLGKYSNNIFDLITQALKIPVSTLLKQSRDGKAKAEYSGIRFMGEKEAGVIDLSVVPVSKRPSEMSSMYAVVFRDARVIDAGDCSRSYDIDMVASQRITDLEQELSVAQEKLDHSVAEQEYVNEELQSANEELLTANEELQSSNEELQSVNEELYTVNSEYQQKLAELSDLNDDIANFLSSTLTGIIFVDNKLNIRRCTNYVTSEFSVMDQDIGRSLAFISYHFPTLDISQICKNVLKTLIPDEREVTTSSEKTFFMRVAPYRSTENKILGCVITLMDITSQKRSQVILQDTEKRLYMVEQASDAKSDYLSRISRDIRVPMGLLANLSKEARRYVGDEKRMLQSLDRINDTVEYMASIVTDISEASISERMNIERMTEPFELRLVIDGVCDILNSRIEEARLNYKVMLAENFNPTYIGNRTKLQQILVIFLNNAIKYTRPGGTVLLRAYEEAEEGKPPRACFIVSDTGIGIKKEYLPRLFKPFTHDECDGPDDSPAVVGLGLCVAYNLITSMQGDVTVDSVEGKGSTFIIRLPLERYSDKDANGDEKRYVPTEYNLAGFNILVCEDNSLNRTILSAMLKNEGMTVTETADGEQAVKAFTTSPEHAFDCILIDSKMPGLDGVGATKRIRTSNRVDARTIPIIAVSANGHIDEIKKARLAGVDDYITKPLERDSLLSAMSKLIKRGG